MTVLRLRLLGGFGCESSRGLLDLPLSMQRLLAFLALRGPSHRSLVAGTLWPEVPEPQALASLRTAVWRMRKLVPDIVDSDGTALSMSAAASVDSREQEAFTTGLLRHRREDDDWLDFGVDSLWRGELLPGWYDDWVVFERERLRQLRLHALERSARLLLERHQLEAALQLALEAVRVEPLRESATAVLMAVYVAEGNAVDAIHQYDKFSMHLERELGIEPSQRLLEVLPPRCRTLRRGDARSPHSNGGQFVR